MQEGNIKKYREYKPPSCNMKGAFFIMGKEKNDYKEGKK